MYTDAEEKSETSTEDGKSRINNISRQQRLFRQQDRYILYASIPLSLSLSLYTSNSFSIKSSYPIIVTSRTRFATPQSFLRPKGSQITPVTRSNFAQQRRPEYKHCPTVCGSFHFKSRMETNFRIRTVRPHPEWKRDLCFPRRCIIKAIMPFARKQVYTQCVHTLQDFHVNAISVTDSSLQNSIWSPFGSSEFDSPSNFEFQVILTPSSLVIRAGSSD